MTIDLYQKYYKDKHGLVPFLIYQVSTGNLYICSTETAQLGIMDITDKIRYLVSKPNRTVELGVSELSLEYVGSELVSVKESATNFPTYVNNNDFLITRDQLNGESFIEFIQEELKIFKTAHREMRNYLDKKKDLFKQMLENLIGYYNSIQFIDAEKDSVLSLTPIEICRVIEDTSGYDIVYHDDANGCFAITIITQADQINDLTVSLWSYCYILEFKFDLKPVERVFSGVVLNTFEVV